MIFKAKLKKFQDYETKERFRSGLGGLWAHSLAARGNQTRLVESWSVQMSSQGSTEDRQKVAKVPPRTLIWRLLHRFWSENVIHMAATRGKSRKMWEVQNHWKNNGFSMIFNDLGVSGGWKIWKIGRNLNKRGKDRLGEQKNWANRVKEPLERALEVRKGRPKGGPGGTEIIDGSATPLIFWAPGLPKVS